MPRIAVGLQYHGGAFAGWQAQSGLRTVQGVLEEALARVAAQPVALIGAGRTDAGVHAVGQVAHFDADAERSARGWTLGANTELPPDVSVSWAAEVAASFHARYSAESRTYCYLIHNRLARSALAAGRAAMVYQRLEVEPMRAAAAAFLGEHDFSAFRAAECQSRTPVRHVHALAVEREGDWVLIRITANAFLHHMVRNIAGLLIAVGKGKEPPEWARTVLEGRDRTKSAATAPAAGLTFWEVRYARAFGLPAPPDDGPARADRL